MAENHALREDNKKLYLTLSQEKSKKKMKLRKERNLKWKLKSWKVQSKQLIK